jgi:peptide/nickel transport system substrate-binding protein
MTRAALLLVVLPALFPAAARGGTRPRYGGALRLLLPAVPAELDPARACSPSELEAVRALHATLFQEDAAGALRPLLAVAAPETEPDGRAVRIRLTPALRFQDGHPLGAEDVAASLARLAAPGSAHGWIVAAVEGADAVREGRARQLAGVQVLSELELRVRLAYPYPAFAHGLAALPAAVVRAGEGGALVGAGPFRLVRRGEAALELAAWDGFAGGRPFADTAVLAGSEARPAARALGRGEVEAVLRPEPVPSAVPAARETGARSVVVAVVSRRLPAADRVRAALAALDRAELARRVRAPAVPLTALLPPPLLPPGPTGGRGDASGLPPRLTLLVPAGPGGSREAAERLQVKLYDRGVRLAIDAVPPAVLAARIAAGEFELALVETWLATSAPATALAQVAWSAGGPVRGARAIAQVARAEPAALPAVSGAIEDELMAVPLHATGLRLGARAAVQGLGIAPDGTVELGDAWLMPRELAP